MIAGRSVSGPAHVCVETENISGKLTKKKISRQVWQKNGEGGGGGVAVITLNVANLYLVENN